MSSEYIFNKHVYGFSVDIFITMIFFLFKYSQFYTILYKLNVSVYIIMVVVLL